MISDTKPVITYSPCTLEPPISKASSIPDLISHLKSTKGYREKNFSLVQEILIDREKLQNAEIENLKKERDVIEKSHALCFLEKMKMEEQLNNFRRKCEELSDNVTKLEEERNLFCNREKRAEERYQKINEQLANAQGDKCKLIFEMYNRIEELKKEKSEAEDRVKVWEQELKQLNDRMSRRKEKMADNHVREIPVNLELETTVGLQVNNQASGGDKQTVIRENLGSEVNHNSKNLDSIKESQLPHGARWNCDSTGNGNDQSEKEDPLPIYLARENRAPSRSLSAFEVGDCNKKNLNTISGSPGSSTVIHIIDSDEEMACVSNSHRVSRNLTLPHQIKEEDIKESSTLLSKRKRSLRDSDSEKTRSSQELDCSEKQSFALDSFRNAAVFIRQCDDKVGVKCYSQPSSTRCDLYKLNEINDESSSDSDNDSCSDKNMDMLIKRAREGTRCLSEDSLGTKDPELCTNAVRGLYQQQISPSISSKGLSFTKSQEVSQSDKFSNLDSTKEEQFSPGAHIGCESTGNGCGQSGGEGSGNTDLVSTKKNPSNCLNAQTLGYVPSACESAHVSSDGSKKEKKSCSTVKTEMSSGSRDSWCDSTPRKITKKEQSSGTDKVQVTHTPSTPVLPLTHGFHTTPPPGYTLKPLSSSTPASIAPPYPIPSSSSPPSSVTPSASLHQGVTPIHDSPDALVGGGAASSASIQPGQVDASGKVYIIPDCNNTFYPSSQPVHAITEIIKAFYKDYYPTWSDIPYSLRQILFEEFKKHVWWFPENERKIWKSFEARAKNRLSYLLSQARNKNERPQWIEEQIWNRLVQHWSSEGFKKKSAQAKANRASEKGGCLHTGGPISFGTLWRRMEEELGRPPTLGEIFQRTHMKKLPDGQMVWVEPRAEKTYNEYQQILKRLKHTQSAEDAVNEVDVWLKVIGGKKKGKAYGLGSFGLFLRWKMDEEMHQQAEREYHLRAKATTEADES
ncbi:uncharacterized protein LOC132634816 [Lycium barbarum]|uniref:uncharacterized protein LOC132634816 n=1 Tax=Lycium barbarum TaxID=112863 RepID=UPI00293E69EC|nr:uncharacterized protein LOC132634816 [Lycium barbarum]